MTRQLHTGSRFRGPKAKAERLCPSLTSLRTRPSPDNAGYEHSRQRCRNSTCSTRAQETWTGRQTCSARSATHSGTLSPTISMSPFIRGFQDNVTSWMSSLINQQDGCLRTVAQQATQGRLRQEQLAQTVAHNAAMPSQTNDQVQYLRAQLAHRNAQLEYV